MLHSFRAVRTRAPHLVPSPLPSSFGLEAASVSFRQARAASARPESQDNMDKNQNQDQNKKTGDVMSHSFGEGYSTRSDEEGFGGVYGDNQSLPKKDGEKEVHENHPEYDKGQGTQVSEKEKGRNQSNIS